MLCDDLDIFVNRFSQFSASAVKQIFMQAMHEIEEKTKVNGKTCIKFNPRHGETAYVRFQTGSGYVIVQF